MGEVVYDLTRKKRAAKFLEYYNQLNDKMDFLHLRNKSMVDTFESIMFLACATTDVWFDEGGHPGCDKIEKEDREKQYGKFIKTFIARCAEFNLIHHKAWDEAIRLRKHIEDPFFDEVSHYWNLNILRPENKKNPLESVRIFFSTCFCYGEWNFSYCQKYYNEKEKQELLIQPLNVYDFEEHKKNKAS